MAEEPKIKVLLIEDDEEECEAIAHCTKSLDTIELVGTTGDSDKGILMTKDLRPNVVLLDLELTYGFGSGFRYLSTMQEFAVKERPLIIVTTIASSRTMWESVRGYGVDYILYKNKKEYCAEFVLHTIMQLFASFPNQGCTFPDDVGFSSEQKEVEKRIHMRITEEFFRIGFPSNLTGRRYLAETICILIMKDDDDSRTFRQLIFSQLAEKYDKTISSINRGMVNAIESTWKHGDLECILKHYKRHINSDSGFPTINEFVYYYAEKIKRELI